MAADVQLTGRDATSRTDVAPNAQTAQTTQIDPGFRSMLTYANGDPQVIASQMIYTGRTQDPRIWNEIQQTLGNSMAMQIREAITRTNYALGKAEQPVAQPEQAQAQAQAPTATKAPEIKPTPDQAPVVAAPEAQVAEPEAQTQDTVAVEVHRNVLGVEITAPPGVRLTALDQVTKIIQTEIGNNEYAQEHFAKSKVTIIIIPAHVQMTELPQLQHLKGQKTFDGRDWSGVRGMGGSPTPDGHYSVAVAEESVVSVKNALSDYPTTYSVGMHELAHVLEAKGMTSGQRHRVKDLYNAHIKTDPANKDGTFTDDYAASNEQEYFAQCTNAFFDKNVMGTNHSGRAWLQRTDPDMYSFLVEIYDTRRDKRGEAAA